MTKNIFSTSTFI